MSALLPDAALSWWAGRSMPGELKSGKAFIPSRFVL